MRRAITKDASKEVYTFGEIETTKACSPRTKVADTGNGRHGQRGLRRIEIRNVLKDVRHISKTYPDLNVRIEATEKELIKLTENCQSKKSSSN